MILATQSIKELEESGMLQIVSESCPTKIFLANPEMDRDLYREAFHLNDTELELIAGLVPPGQMLIRKAQSSKKVHLNVDSVTHWTAAKKIMEAATGDKDFWVVDVVGNFCFVHPAKAGISSNLNIITDKGNIYSFTLQDVSSTSAIPDLKVLVEPADRSSIVAASGPPQFVPAAQLEQSKAQLSALQSHVNEAVDEYKSAYQTQLKFDYVYRANEAPFDIQSIYHDDKFTYIKTNAPEKFSVYEMKDGKPNLISYDLREGTYVIPKVMNSGYVELGKKRMEFSRKG
jgi:type IV secretion system protein VirB9